MQKTVNSISSKAPMPVSRILFFIILDWVWVISKLLGFSSLPFLFLAIICLHLHSYAWQVCETNAKVTTEKQNREEAKTPPPKAESKDSAVPRKTCLVKADDEKLCVREVKMVIEALGAVYEETDGNYMDALFEEEKPSLEEVKEAFGIFDRNSDGFIDADELREVLSALGFMEASEEDCRRMIKAFDVNADCRIDLGEFVKLVEQSFC